MKETVFDFDVLARGGKTTVFDRYLVMQNRVGLTDVDVTLDKLDEMLNTYGIKHSFTLPRGEDYEKYPNAAVIMQFTDADDMVLSLVYALFCKVYRNVDDNRLAEGLVKSSNRYISLTETMANTKAINISTEAAASVE
jgi:hypothetical protein